MNTQTVELILLVSSLPIWVLADRKWAKKIDLDWKGRIIVFSMFMSKAVVEHLTTGKDLLFLITVQSFVIGVFLLILLPFINPSSANSKKSPP